MEVFYCDHFELPLPKGHRFPIQKYRLAREQIASRLGSDVRLRVADAASYQQLASVHTNDYLDCVFGGTLSDLQQRRIGFPWSPKMLERCRRSTGATIACTESALENGLAGHLSGGTHHAFPDEGQGYCVFNDIAVATTLLLNAGKISRAVVIDLDVHQGNGTAAIFQDDARVFTFSAHGDRNYPFRKTTSDLDIALPDGTHDEEYLALLWDALQSQLPLAQADLVLYLAGADPFVGDRLGRLQITKQGLKRRDEMVLEACVARQIPTAIVLAGGYADIEDVAEIHTATISTAVALYHQSR